MEREDCTPDDKIAEILAGIDDLRGIFDDFDVDAISANGSDDVVLDSNSFGRLVTTNDGDN